MKFKFLKDVHSLIGYFKKDTVHELDVDVRIIEDWIKQGLMEVIKEVKKRENKPSNNQ